MILSALPPVLFLAVGFIAAAMSGDLRERSGSGLFALMFAVLLFGLQAVLWVRFGFKLSEAI